MKGEVQSKAEVVVPGVDDDVTSISEKNYGGTGRGSEGQGVKD